jgi:hypothetical protein
MTRNTQSEKAFRIIVSKRTAKTKMTKNADDQTLRSTSQKAVEDEGYELDLTSINSRR